MLQNGQLVDNELCVLLVNPLPHGVRMHAIIDACHSGSVLDLEYRCDFQGGQPVWTNEYSHQPRVWKVACMSCLPGPKMSIGVLLSSCVGMVALGGRDAEYQDRK